MVLRPTTTKQAGSQAKRALSAAELDILRTYCEVTQENQVRITKQLAEASYERMKCIFERLGGVYLPGHKRFAFDLNPLPLLERTIALGEMPEKNPLDFYWSPALVREALFRELEWDHTMDDLIWQYEQHGRPIRVIETGAGLGHLVDAFRERYPMATIDVCELDSFRRAVLESKRYRVVAENAFEYQPEPHCYYDVAFLNPAFSTGGDPFTFIKHILHAYGMLFENRYSKLVSVVPAQFSRVARYREFYIQVLQYGSFEDLPQGSFVESGTTWDTSVITLRKQMNPFYATWDEPDTEDGFPNKRLREMWRYASIDERLSGAEQHIIEEMLEGQLVVYSDGTVCGRTKERISAFCQLATERLLSEYQLYIPLSPSDRESVERHILFDYQLARGQYSEMKRWEWERTQERKRAALQATIVKEQERVHHLRNDLLQSKQILAHTQSELQTLEWESAWIPEFLPALQPARCSQDALLTRA